MYSIGLNLIFRMGCACMKESVYISGNRYFIRQQLGEGGFSTVDMVEDSRTRKLYALKRIRCHSSNDQKVALLEAEYHQQLDHPNILTCLGSELVGVADIMRNDASEVLLLLPYYSRGTLQDELSKRSVRKDHYDEQTVLQLFYGICDAVQHIHQAKPKALNHYDLKPGNVLLSDNMDPVLMDLGSMKDCCITVKDRSHAQQMEDWAAERCSMPYRAPELFHLETGSSLDQRSDIWSLGCLLYALCFFKSPFDAAHERGDSVALAVASGVVTIPDDSPYSQDLHDAIRWMLTVDHTQRPFIHDVITRVSALLEKNEGKL